MPLDSFGIVKLYPDSINNPMSWYISSTNDPRTDEGGDLGGMRNNGGVFSWSKGNNKARYNVMTTAGYSGSAIEKNHGRCASRGYMMDARDWRNVEMTMYCNVQAGADDQMVWYCRGGRHTGSGNCEGFAYKADLYFSGKTRFAKEEYHVSYDFTNSKSPMGSIEGKWVGFKACVYNNLDGTAVVLEIWLDRNANNVWERVDVTVDRGNWNSGNKCGGASGQIGTWGGPFATMRWDNADSVDIKWCSVREINPYLRPNEGGSNSGAGAGAGGSGYTGSGGSPSNTGNPYSGGGSGGTVGDYQYGLTGDSSTNGLGTTVDGNNQVSSIDPGQSDTQGSGGGAQISEPPPIFTIFVDRTYLLNVGVDTEDNCTAGLPLTPTDYTEIYSVSGETLQYDDLGYGTGIGNTNWGQYVANVESLFYGEKIRKVRVNDIHRTVDGELNTCSGNLYCKIINLRTGLEKAQIGGAVNVAGIDVNDQALEFIQDNNQHRCEVGDAIVLEYADASAAVDKCIKVKTTTMENVDNVNSFLITKNDNGWDATNKDRDATLTISI